MSGRLYVLFLYPMIASSCGGSKSDTTPTSPTNRNGRALSKVETRYIDEQPSLSGDATKIAFISGRSDDVYRVFTASRTSTSEAFGAPARLSTDSGLTSELNAKLSPDGGYVLIQGSTTTGQALVLCNFSGATCTSVSSEPWDAGQFEFSADSTQFFYLAGTSGNGGSLYVSTVAAPTTSHQVGSSDQWSKAFWFPVASGYKLIAAETSATLGKINLQQYSFAAPSAASSATATTYASNLSSNALFGESPLGTTAASRVVLATTLTPSSAFTISEIGNVPAASQKKIPLIQKTVTLSDTGTEEASLTTSGYKHSKAYIASDADTIFTLSYVAGRCDSETSLTYGTSLLVNSKSAGTSTTLLLKKPTDLSQPPSVAESFCDRAVNGTTTGIDLSIEDFVVNAAASSSSHSIAWTSSMTGDPEIFVMDRTSSQNTLRTVSANRKP